MCGSFSPVSDVTAAVAAQPKTSAKQPRIIPRSNRRFYKGEWQRPTEIGRGWRPSIGLEGLTYEQGVQKLDLLNRNRINPFVNVTTPDQIPIQWSPNAVVEGGILTDPPEPIIPAVFSEADADEIENFLNTEAAREENQVHEISATLPSEFAARFNPIVNALPNGGLALVLDSSTAMTMLRTMGAVGGRDRNLAGRLMDAAQEASPALVFAAFTTIIDEPVQFGRFGTRPIDG